MNARKPVAIGMVAALGLAGAIALANAETPNPPAPPPAADAGPRGPDGPGGGPGSWGPGGWGHGGWGPGMGRWMNGEMDGRGPGRRFSKEDRAAFFDARIAGVHAGLHLTADQEKLWSPVESAVRDMAKSMIDLRDKREAAGRPKDPIDGMQRMAQASIARGEAMKKVADAAAPLYAALTPEQKERLPALAHPGMRQRMGTWMRDHGMHFGWGRDGGPGGSWRQGDADHPRMMGPPGGDRR
jgi:zinc resistance-associated protein